ncbi:MAG: hypothetical protein RR066_04730 [Mucinivorans sp.]
MASSESWQAIFDYCVPCDWNFDVRPFFITAQQIKLACQDFRDTSQKEVRILCKQDTRESRPNVFIAKGLFLLPVRNGEYAIIKGEGYVDILEIESPIEVYDSKLDFVLDSVEVGNSEMQHVDFAYASSLIRTFMDDPSLVMTIRGRKYTPEFSFRVGVHDISVKSVQTEVDAGYEGRNKIVLIEAKNSTTKNTIIRQLYYPFMQWKEQTYKDVSLLFFEKRADLYLIWQYGFEDNDDYNSIKLIRSARYTINSPQNRRNG